MTATAVEMSQVLPILLPLIWAGILALAVFLYVLLGGYDLGLGVLFPLAPSHRDRDWLAIDLRMRLSRDAAGLP